MILRAKLRINQFKVSDTTVKPVEPFVVIEAVLGGLDAPSPPVS